MRIQGEFLAGTIFIILLSVAATSFVLAGDTRALYVGQISERAKLLMNSVRGIAVESVVKKDQLTLNYYLKEAASEGNVAYIVVTDRNGTIIGSARPEDAGSQAGRLYPAMVSDEKDGTIRAGGREIKPLKFSGDFSVRNQGAEYNLGRIYIGFDKSVVDARVAMIYIKAAVIAGIVLTVAVFMMLFLTGTIIGPLKVLTEGTQRIAAGDLRYKIKLKTKNEFQSLANSFNAMTDRLNEYFDGVLNAFTMAIDAKNKYVPGHSRRVSRLCVSIGRAVDLAPRQLENMRLAALLMDIGNLGIDDPVLKKKEQLTPDDLLQIQKHTEIGARILKHIPALKDIVPIVLQHHERYDGLGYPAGLKAGDILPEARILSVADSYDAMITEREHRKAMPVEEAVFELRMNKGKQFDPDITEAFIGLLHKDGGV